MRKNTIRMRALAIGVCMSVVMAAIGSGTTATYGSTILAEESMELANESAEKETVTEVPLTIAAPASDDFAESAPVEFAETVPTDAESVKPVTIENEVEATPVEKNEETASESSVESDSITDIAPVLNANNNNISATVDNSVDKTWVRVIGTFNMSNAEGRREDFEFSLTVYDSGYIKSDYHNPRNDYVESCVEECIAKVEQLVRLSETSDGASTYYGYSVSETTTSYDHRVYSWVTDSTTDDVIYTGDNIGDTFTTNKSRHMVISGDYGVNMVIRVEGTGCVHDWDEGQVTKEATTTEEGVITYTCSTCDKTKTETIPVIEEEEGSKVPTSITISGPVPSLGKSTIPSDGCCSVAEEGFTIEYFEWNFSDYDDYEASAPFYCTDDWDDTFLPGRYYKAFVMLTLNEDIEGTIPSDIAVTYNGAAAYADISGDGEHALVCYVFDPMFTTISSPIYKGDITADRNTHTMNEFYDLGYLPKNTYFMSSIDSVWTAKPKEEFLSLSYTDPIEGSFIIRLPVGYSFEGGSIETTCEFRILEADPDEKEPVSYKITSGAGQKHILQSDGTLTFTCDAALTVFDFLKIDEEVIDAANYTAISGSTVLTLKNEYLNKLSVGTHTIQFICEDGESDIAEYEVAEAEKDPDEKDPDEKDPDEKDPDEKEEPGDSDEPDDPQDPDDTVEPDKPDKPDQSGNTDQPSKSDTPGKNTDKTHSSTGATTNTTTSVKTGDSADLLIWLVVLVIALSGFVAIFTYRKKSIGGQ